MSSRWDVRHRARPAGPRARRVTVPHFRIKSYRLSPVSFYRLSIGRNGHSLSSAHGLIGRGPAPLRPLCNTIVTDRRDLRSDTRCDCARSNNHPDPRPFSAFVPSAAPAAGPRQAWSSLAPSRYPSLRSCSIRRTPRADRWTVRALCRVGLLVPTIMFGGAQRKAP